MGKTILSRPRSEETRGNRKANPYHGRQVELFFLTEGVASEIAAAGSNFKPPSHARMAHPRHVWMAARRDAGNSRRPTLEQVALILLI